LELRESPLESMEVNFKNKNILVTGGTGFVGSHLIEELINHKANVITTFESLEPRSYFFTGGLNEKTTMINCDVCDFDRVFDIVTKYNVSHIFHLAAQPLVEIAYYNPRRTLESNILGTINVLESARLFPRVKGILIASSDKAYGELNKNKYIETDALKGDHPYEVSKSSADLVAYSYYKTYDVPVVITRFGNVYGEGDLYFSRIIPGILESVIKKQTLKVRSDGKYVRDYLYVKDVVSGYLLLAKNIFKVKGEAFNFGSKESLSVLGLIKLVEKILSKKIKYKILNTAKNEIIYQSLDFKKIQKLGWSPNYSLSSTIDKTYKWYNEILGNEK